MPHLTVKISVLELKTFSSLPEVSTWTAVLAIKKNAGPRGADLGFQFSYVRSFVSLFVCLPNSKFRPYIFLKGHRDKGTKGQKDKGTKERNKGTKGQRKGTKGKRKKGQRDRQPLGGKKNHGTFWDKKSHATSQDKTKSRNLS